jgi:CheY-like chemotaxis protein
MKEIIVVEDSTEDADQVKQALKEAGLKNPVRLFERGEQALDYLESARPPAMICLDIKLPGISAFEILDLLRERPAYQTVLRVVFSSFDDIQTIKQVYAHGAHTFLSKPIRPEEISEFVRVYQQWLKEDNGMESKARA